MDKKQVAGVAGLPHSIYVNGCDTETGTETPPETPVIPKDCRTYPPIPCGWTYFVERADGLIKIGFSEKPSSRIANHRRQFGTIKILAVVPQSVAGEFDTHQKFAGLRVEGEWFRCSSNLLAFIRRVRKAGAKIAPSTVRPSEQSSEYAELDRMSLNLCRFRAPLRRDDRRYWLASNVIEQIVSYQDADDDAHKSQLKILMAGQIEMLGAANAEAALSARG